MILLDLRIPPVKLKPWQLLLASFCEVLHKSHRTTSDKWRGIKNSFLALSEISTVQHVQLMHPGCLDCGLGEKDRMPPENPQLHPNITVSSTQAFQMSETISQIQIEGRGGTRV